MDASGYIAETTASSSVQDGKTTIHLKQAITLDTDTRSQDRSQVRALRPEALSIYHPHLFSMWRFRSLVYSSIKKHKP